MTIYVEGRVEVIANLNMKGQQIPGEVNKAIRASIKIVEKSAKQKAPVDTGALKASINSRMISELEGEIVDGVHYGIHLEYGTRKMRPRPFFRPALIENKNKINNLIQKAVKKVA